MTGQPNTELEDALDEVLRGIGRNVLNLQKMEGMLKRLVAVSKIDVQGTDMQKSVRGRIKAVSKMPMGRLVDDFVKTILPNPSGAEKPIAEGAHCRIETSLRFDDEVFTRGLAASMRTVVKERNELIHKKLANFDPKSLESARNLAAELEEQRQRIKPQFEALLAIYTALRDFHKELSEYVNSGQFLADFQREHESGLELPPDN